MSDPAFWETYSRVLAYAVLVGLQVVWWLDARQWQRHMSEGIRAQGVELARALRRELTRRAAGIRPPLP